MKNRIAFLFLLVLATCQTNPETGRSQLLLFSDEREIEMGLQAFNEISRKVEFETDPRLLEPLQRVGRAIAAAANRPDYQWEFKLIRDDKTVNAWALPGGKVALYTGIYPVLQDEAGMAVVMGHEVIHAIYRHGNERMSQKLIAAGVLTAAAVSTRNSDHRAAIMLGFGVGTTYGVLKYSRKHETEADEYGLRLAARAGYDPRAGIGVWQRMAEQGGARAPEFLSTHPDPDRRIENMRKWSQRYQQTYEESDKKQNRRLPPIR